MKTRELPGKINPGDELEVQLAPFGDFPNVAEVDGKRKKVTQRFGPDDAEKIVAAFDGELLVDADHASCGGGSTLAYAWVTSLRADPELGLMGVFRFTDKGAEAVNSREYRFLSVAWFCDEGGHPFELDSVALTNRPNLPVRPILNRKPADVNPPVANGAGTTKEPEMDKIKQMLGLGAEAIEEEILAAVQTVIDRRDELEKAAADAEAEQFAAENAACCDDREKLKNSYLKDKALAKRMVANMRVRTPAAKPGQKLLNAAAAKAPAIGKATKDGALAAFPAQELVRVRERKARRDWEGRWRAAGGRFFAGRMVALKTDPVWTKISRFGTPYPPFDFNSGMGVEDVGRAEAIALGVIKEGDPPQHVERRGFNDGLGAAVPFNGDRDELWLALRDRFGDQITNNGKEIRWRTESIHESFENHAGFRMNCGKASGKMLRLGGETAEPFRDFKLVVDDEWLQRPDGHGYKHFKPVAAHPEDIVLNEGDLDLIPEAWRNPDRVTSGGTAGTVICELDTLDGGTLHLVAKQRNVSKRIMRLATMYKTKK